MRVIASGDKKRRGSIREEIREEVIREEVIREEVIREEVIREELVIREGYKWRGEKR